MPTTGKWTRNSEQFFLFGILWWWRWPHSTKLIFWGILTPRSVTVITDHYKPSSQSVFVISTSGFSKGKVSFKKYWISTLGFQNCGKKKIKKYSVENSHFLFLKPSLSRLYLLLPFKHSTLQQFSYLDQSVLLPSFQSAEHGAVCCVRALSSL